ncbi:hypothetical protein [Rhizobium leguminosarum]|uniref:Uncharacterized protein n=1 Tax=Rhizobium leguminosarum TaxID=384 RepID=A0A2K9YXD1_RHILE|nr:hypothetical protein [Rhizobium leguminosarum]AUW40617.1 hypothetical protein CUJ84_Chr000198 [Rhizobium leguminosarum]
MAFRSHENNPVAELVELHASIHETNGDSFEMRATLLINPDEIDVGDYTIRVNIHEAYLSVDAFGCAVDLNTKHGKRVHAESVPRNVATERSLKVGVGITAATEAAAEVSFATLAAALKANQKHTNTRTTDVSLSERQEKTTEHSPGSKVRGYIISKSVLRHSSLKRDKAAC